MARTPYRRPFVGAAGALAAVSTIVAACVAQDGVRQPVGAQASRPSPPPTSSPTTQPAGSATRPASTAPAVTRPAVAGEPTSGDKAVDAILDRLEAKGDAIQGLSCRIIYKYITTAVVEDVQTKEGSLLFARAEPNPRFLIHFEKLIAGGAVLDRHEYFGFDGEWATERVDASKQVKKWQVVRKGDRVDPFRLGKGPFPLPFGQKRRDILQSMTVKLAPFELGDPRNTDHLRCVPLPTSELSAKYARVDFFIDRTLELPVRVVLESIKDGSRTEVDFQDVDAGAAPALSRLQVAVPGDFEVTVEPLDTGAAPPSPGRSR